MKQNSPKVSIIVLVYKAELYMERCARSLFEQTLEDIEYIFINDCTPDHSMEIMQKTLKQYPERAKQVQIINHPYNMGAAKSREDGIKAAVGEYIIHCDSDDWVDTDMYRLLYEEAKKKALDIVVCDFYETDGIHHNPIYQNLDKCTDILRGLINRSVSGSLCYRMATRALYEEIKDFPQSHMMEDVNYSIQLHTNSKARFGYLPVPLYYYYHNNQSICHHPSDASCIERCRQACVNINCITNFLGANKLEYKYRHEIVILKNSARVFIWPLYMREPRKYRTVWRSIYPEINNKYPFTPCIRKRLRLNFFLANIGIYPYILNLYRWLTRKH